jgi:hypothetical protein
MNDSSTFLLEDCFWAEVERDVPAEQTPLFTGQYDRQDLLSTLRQRFGLSAAEAEFELFAARQEVTL